MLLIPIFRNTFLTWFLYPISSAVVKLVQWLSCAWALTVFQLQPQGNDDTTLTVNVKEVVNNTLFKFRKFRFIFHCSSDKTKKTPWIFQFKKNSTDGKGHMLFQVLFTQHNFFGPFFEGRILKSLSTHRLYYAHWNRHTNFSIQFLLGARDK